ncbi:MAG: MBL fold metallo-hydrolase [Candidatus Hodarchaeales archaeon]|jgi:L-ascorbate metabolism protein UlaG (beta-lactamase superfamily)
MSTPTITYLGQSCFLLDFVSSKILIDPGNKANGRMKGDIVYATHRHVDHTAGINEFLEFNEESTILIGNKQVTKNYVKWGDRVKTIEDGETMSFDNFDLEFISARHGLFRGEKNIGIIISFPSFKFGHLGDGVSFNGFADKKVDMLAVPIAGIVTASPKRAIRELSKFEEPPPIIVPIHWLFRSTKGFCKKLGKRFPQTKCLIPKKGEILSY